MTDDLVVRIKDIFNSVTAEEQAILRQILVELADTGESETYNDVWLSDYKEIPVSKHRFLTDPEYLGASNNNGQSIYPAWMNVMQELERTGNQYYEIVLTGATRTGKTSTAVSDCAYNLYKLMCLRNPQEYFSLKAVTTIQIFFFNITQTLAKGVAMREMMSTLGVSPWFMAHGKMSKSEEHPVYIPDGGLIKVSYGSESSHALGMATYCLVGDTQILCVDGLHSLSALAGQTALCAQYDPVSSEVVYLPAYVACTSSTYETVRLELSDGSVIEGTPDHRLMLTDGSYLPLVDITPNDEVMLVTHSESRPHLVSVNHIYHDTPVDVYDVVEAVPHHNFIVVSGSTSFVAHNCVIFDECNFAAAGIKDVAKAKARMKAKYDTLVARVSGTFVKNGEVFGKLYVISSKNSDSDFMEEYVRTQQAAGNQHMYVFDKPQWEVWPPSKYSSDKKFKVALGGKHTRSFVINESDDTEAAVADLVAQGYSILEVPEDNKARFLADIDIALRDIAGVTVPGQLSFITQEQIDCCIGARHNPFYTDIVTLGTRDNLTIEEFFHLSAVDPRLKSAPNFIHLDLSLNTDRTGISMVCVHGVKDIADPDGKVTALPYLVHIFTVALQAPRGSNIAFDKIVSFISWLRRQGFNIAGVSRDQFQSEYLGQLLEAKGFNDSKISLDRTPDGYLALRSVLTEQRIDLLHVELLENELIHLQRDAMTGRCDHPANGSKDAADSLAGAVWNAVQQHPGVAVPSVTVANIIAAVNKSKRVPNSLPSMFGGFSKL